MLLGASRPITSIKIRYGTKRNGVLYAGAAHPHTKHLLFLGRFLWNP
jgi:hypothetical protein